MKTVPQPDTGGPGSGVDLRSLWSLIDPATQQWFMDHTGTAIVPRTITAALCRASDQPLPQDSHGQFRLTGDDMLFIRNRAHSAFAAHGTERFFEAVQPKDPSQGHPPQSTDVPYRT
ncbi:hypothetical protein FCN77_14770 [Arthrobacter sp. 24S4-2]|uniref:hypothetical protein n=1 Tax=Arthrobacter sp. 24S4-2 TaxID=2575374 RepID=UPI0010C7CF55|nr:hypothetical protein [Arthrobacter sp. 24S4-2]QCO98735.1 hypothetical protein FCN77_14770 [Arthrobacter sp. 24S4-2]